MELPELNLDAGQRRIIELSNNQTGLWDRFRIERFSVDGRCLLRRMRARPGAHPILTNYDSDPTAEFVKACVPLDCVVACS